MDNYIFIGGTYRGFRVLESLLKEGHLPRACFVLEEDKHEAMKYSPEIIGLAAKHKIRASMRKKLSEADYAYIRKNRFEFAVVCGWRTIIRPEAIKDFKLGLAAAHDSLLPKYRGFAPLNWAMINGEKETGVTLFLIDDKGVDSGPVISRKKVAIEDSDYAIDLYKKITAATIELYREFFGNYRKGKIKLHKQDEGEATYTCKRVPEDGRIEWARSSKEVLNLMRALAHPYTGAYCHYGKDVFHIRKARRGKNDGKEYAGSVPGRVIDITAEGIEVLCGRGSVEILEWENKDKGMVGCPSLTVKSISSTLR